MSVFLNKFYLALGKRVKLSLENEIDFSVLAISTNFKLHRLCYLLNSTFHLDFSRKEDYTLDLKQSIASFPICVSKSNDHDAYYFLLKNNANEAYLLPEVKQTDFVLIAKGRQCDLAVSLFHNEVKHLDNIQASFILEESKLKHIHNLLFDNDYTQQN